LRRIGLANAVETGVVANHIRHPVLGLVYNLGIIRPVELGNGQKQSA
jgi:hypothetical protein